MPKPVLLDLILRVLRAEDFFYGTFQSILLQSGLKENDFFDKGGKGAK